MSRVTHTDPAVDVETPGGAPSLGCQHRERAPRPVDRKGPPVARYLLIVTFEPGVVDSPMEEWQPEEVTAHLDYYRALNAQLVENGELVDATVLTPPDAARSRPRRRRRRPVVTDGPFQEFKEWVAGFQVIDVDTRGAGAGDRRAGLGGARPGWRAAAAADPRAPGHGRRPGRRRLDERVAGGCEGCSPARSRRDRRSEDLLRELAPRVLGTLAAARVTSPRPRTPCRRRWSRRTPPGRATASPTTRTGWLLTAASRRLVDEQRSDAARRRRERAGPSRSPRAPRSCSTTTRSPCC